MKKDNIELINRVSVGIFAMGVFGLMLCLPTTMEDPWAIVEILKPVPYYTTFGILTGLGITGMIIEYKEKPNQE